MQTSFLEGHFVIEGLALGEPTASRRGFVGTGGSKGLLTRIPTATISTRTRHEIDAFSNNLELAALVSVIVLPLVQLQTTFDENATAFFQVLITGFGLSTPDVNVDECGFLFFFLAP